MSNVLHIIPITAAALKKMPKRMARRLRPGMRSQVAEEFDGWLEDMGYQQHMASPLLRQFMYESFIGGWGAKTREYRKKMQSDD